MRWLTAALVRVGQLLGVWLALMSWCCCANTDNPDRVAGNLGRTLFMSVALLLFVEWRRSRAVMRGLSRELADGLRAEPLPLRGLPAGQILLLGMGIGLAWLAWHSATATDLHALLSEDPFVGFVALQWRAISWTAATLAIGSMIRQGIMLARLRRAARNPTRPTRRQERPVAIPLTVAMMSAATLALLAFLRPGLIAIVVAAQVASVLREPVTQGPRVELLVSLQPGRSIADVDVASGTLPEPLFLEDMDDPATWVVTVPPSAALGAVLAQWLDPDVLRVELNLSAEVEEGGASPCVGAVYLPVDDPLAVRQSGLQAIGGAGAIDMLARRAPVAPAHLAIVDTGVNGLLRDLRGAMGPFAVADDRHGHGTGMAGAAAAVANNGIGIASLNVGGSYVRISSYPALAEPNAAADDVARAIAEAADDGADVINLSFSGVGATPAPVVRAIRYADERGAVVVAAAGNQGGDASAYWPANAQGVLVVGASQDGRPAPFSNSLYGVQEKVWAPGTGVCTLDLSGDPVEQTGSSAAAALVSGVIASMRALCPEVSAADARRLVAQSGTTVGYRAGNTLRADVALQRMLAERPDCHRRWRPEPMPDPWADDDYWD